MRFTLASNGISRRIALLPGRLPGICRQKPDAPQPDRIASVSLLLAFSLGRDASKCNRREVMAKQEAAER
jgi:hypothetical protein